MNALVIKNEDLKSMLAKGAIALKSGIITQVELDRLMAIAKAADFVNDEEMFQHAIATSLVFGIAMLLMHPELGEE